MRRVLPVVALALTALAVAPARGAESKALFLRNGAQLRGDVIKETPEALFFDLGFQITAIPRDKIDRVEDLLAGGPVAPSAMVGATSLGAALEPAALELAATRRYDSISQMVEESKRSVVIVSNPAGYGAGFIVDRRGRVLTNDHVVHDQRYHAVTLLLKGDDGVTRRRKIENVELVALSRLLDVALLQLPEEAIKELDVVPLPLAGDDGVRVGDAVYAIGNPGLGRQMLDHTVSEGIVSSANRNIGDILYLQTTAAVNPGNSGGPLLDASGRVIGLVTLKAIFQENIAFALPVSYLKLFLLNEKAFAFDKSNPNRSYRYVSPE